MGMLLVTTSLCIHPNNLAYSVAFMLTIVIDNSWESTHKHMLSSLALFLFACSSYSGHHAHSIWKNRPGSHLALSLSLTPSACNSVRPLRFSFIRTRWSSRKPPTLDHKLTDKISNTVYVLGKMFFKQRALSRTWCLCLCRRDASFYINTKKPI